MRPWALALGSLALLIAGLAIGCSDSHGPPVTKTPNTQDVLFDLDSRSLLEPLGTLIRDQEWYRKEGEDSYALLSAIRTAATALASSSRFDGESQSINATRLAAILKEAAKQPWYRDGLNAAEKRGLSAAFYSYATAAFGQSADETASFFAHAVSTMTLRDSPKLTSGKVMLIGFGEDREQGKRALDAVPEYLPLVDGYFGGLQRTSFISVTVMPGYPQCVTSFYAPAVVLAPNCLDGNGAILHELTHIYMGGGVPLWFTEGVAVFSSANLSGALSRFEDRRAYFQEQGIPPQFHLNYSGPESNPYEWERLAGALFLDDASIILGEERMRDALRSLKGGSGTGEGILFALLNNVPDDRRDDLRRLIDERVIR